MDTLSPVALPLRQPRWMTILGWILTVPPAFMFIVGGIFAALSPQQMNDALPKLGWPLDVAPYIIALEIVCGLLYLFPKTATLGAILLTAYLGGAVATHVRVHDPMAAVPIAFGIILWLALYLRDPRLRQIALWR